MKTYPYREKIMEEGRMMAQTEIYLGKMLSEMIKQDDLAPDNSNIRYKIPLKSLWVTAPCVYYRFFSYRFYKDSFWDRIMTALKKKGFKFKIEVLSTDAKNYEIQGYLWITPPKR